MNISKKMIMIIGLSLLTPGLSGMKGFLANPLKKSSSQQETDLKQKLQYEDLTNEERVEAIKQIEGAKANNTGSADYQQRLQNIENRYISQRSQEQNDGMPSVASNRSLLKPSDREKKVKAFTKMIEEGGVREPRADEPHAADLAPYYAKIRAELKKDLANAKNQDAFDALHTKITVKEQEAEKYKASLDVPGGIGTMSRTPSDASQTGQSAIVGMFSNKDPRDSSALRGSLYQKNQSFFDQPFKFGDQSVVNSDLSAAGVQQQRLLQNINQTSSQPDRLVLKQPEPPSSSDNIPEFAPNPNFGNQQTPFSSSFSFGPSQSVFRTPDQLGVQNNEKLEDTIEKLAPIEPSKAIARESEQKLFREYKKAETKNQIEIYKYLSENDRRKLSDINKSFFDKQKAALAQDPLVDLGTIKLNLEDEAAQRKLIAKAEENRNKAATSSSPFGLKTVTGLAAVGALTIAALAIAFKDDVKKMFDNQSGGSKQKSGSASSASLNKLGQPPASGDSAPSPYHPYALAISSQQLFGRTLNNDELSGLTDIFTPFFDVANKAAALQTTIQAANRDLTADEQKQLDEYQQQIGLFERALFMTELDIRYTIRRQSSDDDPAQSLTMCLAAINNQASDLSLQLSSQSAKLSAAHKAIIVASLANIAVEKIYLTAQMSMEQQIQTIVAALNADTTKSDDDKTAVLVIEYQQRRIAMRQALIDNQKVTGRQIDEPFEHSRNRRVPVLLGIEQPMPYEFVEPAAPTDGQGNAVVGNRSMSKSILSEIKL